MKDTEATHHNTMTFDFPQTGEILLKSPAPNDHLIECLTRRFGLSSFRPMQREAIENILSGNDTLVVMPTGGGKSLCYQLPAILLPGITLVVSPLIALMKDQVDRLQRLGVSSIALNSSLTFAQIRALVRRAQTGEIKVIFVSPERLENSLFQQELGSLNISLVAIDEAHCISEWGHDFRTSYRRLPELFQYLGSGTRPPVAALTATATPEVRDDIVRLLNLGCQLGSESGSEPIGERNFLQIVTGFDRPNLSYGVLRECDKDARLRDIIVSTAEGSIIVYAATRKSVERIAAMLKQFGMPAEMYHAGIPLDVRKSTQNKFLRSSANDNTHRSMRIIVATSAFGMGVDKSNVRVVVHYDLPGSIEAYYQEAGRAGRDGAAAHAVLLYNNGDARIQEFLIRANAPSEADLKSIYSAIHDIAGNPIGSVYPSILQTDDGHIAKRLTVQSTTHRLGEESSIGRATAASIERALEVLEQSGLVRIHRNRVAEHRARVRFTASRGRIDEAIFRSNSKNIKQTLRELLRVTGSEAFTKEVLFDLEAMPAALANQGSQIGREDLVLAFRSIETLGLAKITLPQKSRQSATTFHLELIGERQPLTRLDTGASRVQLRMNASLEKLSEMVRYATEWSCRRNMILRYFGEQPNDLSSGSTMFCRKCDVCIARGSTPVSN